MASDVIKLEYRSSNSVYDSYESSRSGRRPVVVRV